MFGVVVAAGRWLGDTEFTVCAKEYAKTKRVQTRLGPPFTHKYFRECGQWAVLNSEV